MSKLEGGDGKTIAPWMVVNIPKMHDCSDKHKAVVDAYNGVVKILEEFNNNHKGR